MTITGAFCKDTYGEIPAWVNVIGALGFIGSIFAMIFLVIGFIFFIWSN
jgi:hypothetical protein